MIKSKNRILTELLASNDILIPSLLGKKYRFENDDGVYQVIGTRWRSNEIILKEASTEKMVTLIGNEFFRVATGIEE